MHLLQLRMCASTERLSADKFLFVAFVGSLHRLRGRFLGAFPFAFRGFSVESFAVPVPR